MDLHKQPPVSNRAGLAVSLEGVVWVFVVAAADGVESEEDIFEQIKTIRGENWRSKRNESSLRCSESWRRNSADSDWQSQKLGFLFNPFLCQDLHLCCSCQKKMSAAKAPPSKEISPKLRKTIDRLQTRIKESADYEVHQELKAVASRYLPRTCLPRLT
jgi:hypothetical protein